MSKPKTKKNTTVCPKCGRPANKVATSGGIVVGIACKVCGLISDRPIAKVVKEMERTR